MSEWTTNQRKVMLGVINATTGNDKVPVGDNPMGIHWKGTMGVVPPSRRQNGKVYEHGRF